MLGLPLQASCRALLVTHSHLQHDAAAIRLNLGAMAGAGPLVSPPTPSSYDQAMLDKLTPWIVTSPPRPTQSPTQSPFERQPFVAFSYKRPSKMAQEPTVLQLTIAPIDVIYSQLCLLSLLDFLNAAWPMAGLDPLKVRAGVSLREIVQEKLLGGQQQHQMPRRQQHTMQRTKVSVMASGFIDCLFLAMTAAPLANLTAALGLNPSGYPCGKLTLILNPLKRSQHVASCLLYKMLASRSSVTCFHAFPLLIHSYCTY